MTVKELIEKLQALDPEQRVFISPSIFMRECEKSDSEMIRSAVDQDFDEHVVLLA